MIRPLVVLLIALTLWPPVGARAEAPTAADRTIIERLRAHLDGITTLEGRFVQISSTGHFAEGTLYLQRPGRLRFEYAPPDRILLVSDGRFLGYYDLDLGQASHLPINSTPAAFLVRERISFDDGVRVTGFKREGNLVRLSLAKDDEPEIGAVTIVFSEQPLELRQWSVIDQQGIETIVTLQNPRFGGELDRGLFTLLSPEELERASGRAAVR